MRYAVIADVHGNIEAIEAVLRDIDRRFKGATPPILFIGDAVGYGPDPNECIELLRQTASVLLAGNHDRAVLGLTDIEYFNEYAREAIIWTDSVLKEENRAFMRTLELTKSLGQDSIYLVHSTPLRPELWNYLLTVQDAEVNFNHFTEQICFVGHSHQPFIFERKPSGEMVTHRDRIGLSGGSRHIINVGSVGQPRDGNPKACYAIIEDRGVELERVPYDIRKTQGKMRRARLSSHLIERLSVGR